MNRKILLIEDEMSIRKFTKINLEREDFQVYEAETGEKGIEICDSVNIDIIILDIMLPGIDGYEVCRIIRKKYPKIGIIMLTAKMQDVDKIIGLEAGTDDYMIKPFNPKELILRIKSLIRRFNQEDDDVETVEDGPFKLDIYSRSFYKNNKEIELTPTELSLITTFMINPGKAFSRNELLDITWGEDYVGESKIVDVNIRRIRTKIEDNPSHPEYLETVWGVGYRWKQK
ncbi:response regulator transcription factor [Citroniella saccharovorans]|uniref:Response regulator transcription factor n=1 Tax=Citroniella saccharovorans TaxID=2053367 RepID=A0AAW9MPR8_9FIRM|nr:response regulator transcription factor [Citroniella saccharovorans]MEB3429533.1 response regulator transcription factor [Citroniella saccharovorans]